MKDRRGCKRPGEDREQRGPPFMYGSPMLVDDEDRSLRECPVGLNLRETPWVYDLIDAASFCEGTGIRDYLSLPVYTRHAVRLIQSERARLWEEKQAQREAERQSGLGMKARKR